MSQTVGQENIKKTELSHLAGKYLTFRLSGQEFGLEILKVREIIGHLNVTPIPQTPNYVKGIINLRGTVIPVIDLRLKFKMEPAVSDRSCIIILEIQQAKSPFSIGIIVDDVSDVYDIQADEIEDKQKLDHLFNANYILGVGKIEGNLKILLDINKIIEDSQQDANNATHIMETKNV